MKEVGELIRETENKIVIAINESNLHPAIVQLILKNIYTEIGRLVESAREGADADRKS